MQKRFRGLQLIGTILKIFGVIALIMATISLVVAPLALSTTDNLIAQSGFGNIQPGTGLMIGILLGVLLFIACAVAGMLLFALGELFNVVIAIEENTRASVIVAQSNRSN